MPHNIFQWLVDKVRALIAGESDTERLIRSKIEKTYTGKRAPKTK